jgi:hypothetical protein
MSRDRVMVTAGHFTAPATTLGSLPPSVRMFASFSLLRRLGRRIDSAFTPAPSRSFIRKPRFAH